LATLDVYRVLAFSPPEAGRYFQDLARDCFTVLPQGDGDLGRRMSSFFAQHLRESAASVVLVGSDSPTLPTAFIEQAFAALDRAAVVLGPATDGGYYLVGCARHLPSIFREVDWGTSHVLQQTVARFADTAWRLAVLPPWYDVDTLADWQMLRGHVA